MKVSINENAIGFKELMIKKHLSKLFIENGISASYFHFFGYAEEHVCLDKKGGKWVVFVGERGNREGEKAHRSLREACYDMCSRLASDERTLMQLYAKIEYIERYPTRRKKLATLREEYEKNKNNQIDSGQFGRKRG